jgi:hypothetical protein
MDSNTLSLLTNSINIKAGEYLPAYVSRLLSYGSFLKPQDFYHSFSLGVPRTSEGYLPLWALKLSQSGVLGVPFNDIIDNHLCGNFWRPFIDDDAYQQFIVKQLKRKGTTRLLFSEEKPLVKFSPLKYCQRCRDEELERFGFPIWKSRNQLATVFTCSTHGDVLHQKFQRIQPVPDGKSESAFVQEEGVQPEITMFHRWLEFETELIMATNNSVSNGLLEMCRNVFLESSFYKVKNTETDKRLSAQWIEVLRRYLYILFPFHREELWYRIQSENVGIKAMMDNGKQVHPLLLLLFKSFYMFEYKA